MRQKRIFHMHELRKSNWNVRNKQRIEYGIGASFDHLNLKQKEITLWRCISANGRFNGNNFISWNVRGLMMIIYDMMKFAWTSSKIDKTFRYYIRNKHSAEIFHSTRPNTSKCCIVRYIANLACSIGDMSHARHTHPQAEWAC